jgi:cyanophycin synthetase
VFNLITALNPCRRVGVIGVPGDRKDSDIQAVGELCGQQLDYIYIKEDEDLRGRKPGEVTKLLAMGISRSNNPPPVEAISREPEALEAAIMNNKAGDLIVVFYDKLAPLQEVIKQYIVEESKQKQEFKPAR